MVYYGVTRGVLRGDPWCMPGGMLCRRSLVNYGSHIRREECLPGGMFCREECLPGGMFAVGQGCGARMWGKDVGTSSKWWFNMAATFKGRLIGS